MLSVTTYLTTDVAAVPLLWVLPLSIYLLTFIFAFAKRPPIPHKWMCMLLPIVVLVPMLTMSLSLTASWWALMLGHLSALFVAAMVCHGELARDRPSVERLTEFYLLMSVGGAVGGLLNALVAPLVFTSVLEYPIGLLAACLLRPDAINLIAHPSRWPRDLAWGAAALAAGLGAGWLADALGIPHAYGAALGVPVVLAITQWPRARRYALLLAAAFVAVQIHLRPLEPALAVDRGFFGVVKVIAMEDGKYHALMHGNILHGLQPVAPLPPGARQRPVSYYAPVRQIFDAQPATPGTPARSRVGVVGLGIGTLIACGEPHEFWRFYEINPAVVEHGARHAVVPLSDRYARAVQRGDRRGPPGADARARTRLRRADPGRVHVGRDPHAPDDARGDVAVSRQARAAAAWSCSIFPTATSSSRRCWARLRTTSGSKAGGGLSADAGGREGRDSAVHVGRAGARRRGAGDGGERPRLAAAAADGPANLDRQLFEPPGGDQVDEMRVLCHHPGQIQHHQGFMPRGRGRPGDRRSIPRLPTLIRI